MPKETNVASALARIKEIPRIVEEAKRTISSPPKPILETAILQNRGAISFYEKELFELIGPTPRTAELKQATGQAVEAIKSYQTFS